MLVQIARVVLFIQNPRWQSHAAERMGYFRKPGKSEFTVIFPVPGVTVAENASERATLAVVFSVISLFGILFSSKSIFPGCLNVQPIILTVVFPYSLMALLLVN